MYRLRSSIPYEILHGIQFSPNLTILLAYLNYFPPPPPMFPSPPPYSSRICSLSYNEYDRSSLQHFISSINTNQSTSRTNVSSIIITTTRTNSSSINQTIFSLDYIISLIQNHLLFVVLLLSILIFLLFLFVLCIYYHRLRQRHLTSTNKTHQICYHLIPNRRKHRTAINMNEQNLLRLRKDSPMSYVIHTSKTSRNHRKTSNETEEAV